MPDYPPPIQNDLRRVQQEGEVPRHVAIIMDGNGRWARQREVPLSEGHREGVHSVRAIADLCGEIGDVKILTLYAFSTENWERPESEIKTLMDLLQEFLRKEVNRMIKRNVRFDTLGDTEAFPDSVREELERTKKLTQDNDEFLLNLAVNYGGRDEIRRAFVKLASRVQNDRLDPEEIDEGTIARHLDTAGLRDPDLLIRTSGEQRISNFLLWQLAYSEIYFTETLWPEFREQAFLEALFDYQERERRFGRRPDVDNSSTLQ